ncbi:MAG: hypothetical protein P9L90_07055 [Candidatus Aadella gelida]|nr:hypothetical protein [Candidatus Aadella gelida]
MKYVYRVFIIMILGSFLFNSNMPQGVLAFADNMSVVQEIYNTPIPFEIRRNFNDYIHANKTGSEKIVVDGGKFPDIYNKRFFVANFQPNPFGGLLVTIMVKDQNIRSFRLWMYDISEDVYDFRSIEELPGPFSEEIVMEITGAVYNDFWL